MKNAYPERWALHLLHKEGRALQGQSTSNFGESENARLLKPARYLAPYELLQYTMRHDMDTRCDREEEAMKFAAQPSPLRITPKAMAIYQGDGCRGRRWRRHVAAGGGRLRQGRREAAGGGSSWQLARERLLTHIVILATTPLKYRRPPGAKSLSIRPTFAIFPSNQVLVVAVTFTSRYE